METRMVTQVSNKTLYGDNKFVFAVTLSLISL